MKQKCIDAVGEAIGREFTWDEGIVSEREMRKVAESLSHKDPAAWAQMSPAERDREVIKVAAENFIARAKKEQQRVEMKILAHDQIENQLEGAKSGKDEVERLKNRIATTAKGGDIQSQESLGSAIADEYKMRLQTSLDQTGKFWGMLEDRKAREDIEKEMMGEESGNKDAKETAKLLNDINNEQVDRLNSLGSRILKRTNHAGIQRHSRRKVAAFGPDSFREYRSTLLDGDLLDRQHNYIHEDGTPYSQGEMESVVSGAFDSIMSDGQKSAKGGDGIAADAGAQARVLHFKDFASKQKYDAKYGDSSFWDGINRTIEARAHQEALLTKWGPDADTTFQHFYDRAEERMVSEHTPADERNRALGELRDLQGYVSGARPETVNQSVSDRFRAAENLLVATKLGFVPIRALTDEAGTWATSYANKMSPFRTFRENMRYLNPANSAHRRAMNANIVGLHVMGDAIARYGSEAMGRTTWTRKLANKEMQVSFAEHLWRARRAGLSANLGYTLANLTRKFDSITKINAQDHGILASKGFTENHWQVMRAAEPEFVGKTPFKSLTTNSIYAIPDAKLAKLGDPATLKREAVAAMNGHILEEQGMGVMTVGARERVKMGAMKFTPGDKLSELGHSMWLFKSYPVAMISKHWARANSMPTASARGHYFAILAVGSTLINAAVEEMRAIVSGKDPESLASPKFWAKAALGSGFLGLAGDFLVDQMEAGGGSTKDKLVSGAVGMTGPLIGTAIDASAATIDSAKEIFGGGVRHPKATREWVNLARQNNPLKFWYTQAAWDHLVFNDLQEWASPGYLQRLQDRAEKKGSGQWWPSTHTAFGDQPLAPDHAPDLSKALPEMQ